jgi:signal transduction histidine kinase
MFGLCSIDGGPAWSIDEEPPHFSITPKIIESGVRMPRSSRRPGTSLLLLINDILDLSKMEADQLVLEETDFDLAEILKNVMSLLNLRAHEKSLSLVYNLAPDVPTFLTGDVMRLRQILLNLIGNAIKFTERGEVALRVEHEPAASAPGLLRFSVSDTGIGIPLDKLDAIFKSFTQVDSSTSRKYGGTGLGLTISKRLVELMGGASGWRASRIKAPPFISRYGSGSARRRPCQPARQGRNRRPA